MTLMQHFAELRRRILWTVLVFILSFCLGWVLSPYTESFLVSPLINVWHDATLLYTKLSDGLMIQFSLATLVAGGTTGLEIDASQNSLFATNLEVVGAATLSGTKYSFDNWKLHPESTLLLAPGAEKSYSFPNTETPTRFGKSRNFRIYG